MNKFRFRKEAKIVYNDAKITLNMNRDLYDEGTVNEFEEALASLRKERKLGFSPRLVNKVAEVSELTNKRRRPCSSPFIREIVETVFVALGVAMAFRAYFFQPFKIPTGSMQPTLYGIHSVPATDGHSAGFSDKHPFKIFKWALTGVWYKEIVAPNNCAVSVGQDQNAPGYFIVMVGGKKHKVPDEAVRRDGLNIRLSPNGNMQMADATKGGFHLIQSGEASAGDVIWRGWEKSGDQLFVNRLAWNFFPPKRDDVMVFATSDPKIFFSEKAAREEIARHPPRAQDQQAVPVKIANLPLYYVETPLSTLTPGQHYIKRLVGLPGESIGIETPNLLVNGEKVTGLFGIDRVANEYAGYHNIWSEKISHGYRPDGFLREPGDTIELGADQYLPMGDNTLNSSDGRYWGSVPQRNMVGPAAFVYWPISERWGRRIK